MHRLNIDYLIAKKWSGQNRISRTSPCSDPLSSNPHYTYVGYILHEKDVQSQLLFCFSKAKTATDFSCVLFTGTNFVHVVNPLNPVF